MNRLKHARAIMSLFFVFSIQIIWRRVITPCQVFFQKRKTTTSTAMQRKTCGKILLKILLILILRHSIQLTHWQRYANFIVFLVFLTNRWWSSNSKSIVSRWYLYVITNVFFSLDHWLCRFVSIVKDDATMTCQSSVAQLIILNRNERESISPCWEIHSSCLVSTRVSIRREKKKERKERERERREEKNNV